MLSQLFKVNRPFGLFYFSLNLHHFLLVLLLLLSVEFELLLLVERDALSILGEELLELGFGVGGGLDLCCFLFTLLLKSLL